MSNPFDVIGVELDSISVLEKSPGARGAPTKPGPDFRFNFASRGNLESVAAARLAARSNASRIPESEHRALLSERASLLNKRLSAKLSQEEINRLQYVRWSLDRIDDSKHGAQLDALEDLVSNYRRALLDLGNLQGKLKEHLPKKRK